MEAYIRVAALLEKNSRDKRRNIKRVGYIKRSMPTLFFNNKKNIKPTEEADRHISKQKKM